jgi:hypothetical protein
MIVPHETFRRLYSPDITQAEHRRILAKIDSRFCEIVASLASLGTCDQKMWYDYSCGIFNPVEYEEHVEFTGEFINFPEPYSSCFPTRWLWEDHEEEMLSEIERLRKKQEDKKKRQKALVIDRKRRRSDLIESVKKKLTAEELSVISFKKP